MSEQTTFHSWSKGAIPLGRVLDEVIAFIHSEPRRSYRIIIGSDSSAQVPTSLVTALTIWRVGNGGVHFWVTSEKKHFHTLRDRITEEALQSITLAQEIRAGLRDRLGEESLWDDRIQIHIDIGENGSTRDFVDQVVGMVRGFGFQAVIKPDAFGASHVADRHT